MMKIQVAAAVALALSSVTFAQQATQWKVSDGGNGHWYRLKLLASTRDEASESARAKGGELASITNDAENEIVRTVASGNSSWIGGNQAPGSCEPACGWTWLDGVPWIYTRWDPTTGEPNDGGGGTPGEQGIEFRPSGYWNDYWTWRTLPSSIIEWSADCNGDGIVDYGQCRDGSLPDYNGNNIPDCCESGTPCVVGNYPVQWRVADGGNGHWYAALQASPNQLNWAIASQLASAEGGHLATLTTSAESQFVWNWLASQPSRWRQQSFFDGPFLGGIRIGSEWTWVTGEPWNHSLWGPCYPNFEDETVLSFGCTAIANEWNNVRPDNNGPIAAIVEWDSDCNNDGIVDKGQILLGQLVDTNQDGIPDICQMPTCRDADLFHDFQVNGADLGILLSQWGPATPLTVSDINHDGSVNGADLSVLLSFWGPCP